MKSRSKSLEVFEKLKELIPGGCNSPARAFSGLGISPLIAESGEGDLIKDIDNYEYIDFNLAWGSLILGHKNSYVKTHVKTQLDKGVSFGLSTEIEGEFVRKIQQFIPNLEKIRCVNSGTEATMTAVRIARAYTQRKIILKFNGHYHGHSDAFLVKAGSGVAHHFEDASSEGVPKEMVCQTVSIPFNDKEAFLNFYQTYKEDLAAVILEPVAGNMGCVAAQKDFMALLREKTKESHSLLIFDEVISGFRVAKGGAQEFYGIEADLVCLGKIIGAGFPVGIVGGLKKIMDYLSPVGGVYQAGTLSGNPIAMRAGLCVLEQLEKEGFYSSLEKKTSDFLKPIQKVLEEIDYPMCLQQVGAMFSLFFGVKKVEKFEDLKHVDRDIFTIFFQYLLDKGIYFSPSPFESCFISSAHTFKHLEYTQNMIINFLKTEDFQMKSGSLKKEYATSENRS